MELIVAVYDDWGIGCCGTQPVALRADRKFFREQTRGAMVIVGRKTLADFPGGRPLKGRHNIVLTRQDLEIPGAEVYNRNRANKNIRARHRKQRRRADKSRYNRSPKKFRRKTATS